tara:strand:- start:729 stop:902 length:174 start_codon:yes stop_codon:yes gene_type:complete
MITNIDYGSWIDEELERLLTHLKFQKEHFAETFTERSELNLEIQRIKKELRIRKKDE